MRHALSDGGEDAGIGPQASSPSPPSLNGRQGRYQHCSTCTCVLPARSRCQCGRRTNKRAEICFSCRCRCIECGKPTTARDNRCRRCVSRAGSKAARQSPRNNEIVGLYFSGLTLRELADRFGVSYQRIHQICSRQRTA